MSERNAVWLRILSLVVPLAAAALIGWGSLRSDVSANSRVLDKKADKETVDVQYQSILRELAAIRADISDLKAGRR